MILTADYADDTEANKNEFFSYPSPSAESAVKLDLDAP